MKKLLISLLAFCCIFSCTEEISTENSSDVLQLSSRAIVDSENISVTNPDFINDWENMNSIVLNTSTPENKNVVTLPWGAGSSSSIPEKASYDVKKEDGWRMLFHTFKDYGLDKHQNYFILYNDFTGILRVYYFCENQPEKNNSFMWNLRTINSSADHIFESNTYPLKSLDAQPVANNIKLSNYTANEYSSLSYGWNAFEIPITYSVMNANVEYLITAVNTNVTSIKLLGSSKGTIDGKIVSTTSSENTVLRDAANLSKDAVKGYLDKLLKGEGDTKLATTIKNGISNFMGGVVKNGVNAGLKYLFGNVFQANVNTQNFDVNLTLQTEMELTGIAAFPSVAQIVPLNNIDLKKYNGGKDLGVWNIEKTPKVYFNKYSPVELNIPQWGESNPDPEAPKPAYLYVHAPDLEYDKPDVIVNPSLQQYLKSQSVNYELVNCRRLDNFDLQGYDFDLLSFMLDDEKGSLELLYYNKESNISVYKMNKNFYGEIYVNTSGYYKDNCQLVYDWSGIKDDTFVLIVTVDQIFDFNGKEIQVSSAKHFKAEFEMLPNWYYIYPVGVSYVVNKDQILER